MTNRASLLFTGKSPGRHNMFTDLTWEHKCYFLRRHDKLALRLRRRKAPKETIYLMKFKMLRPTLVIARTIIALRVCETTAFAQHPLSDDASALFPDYPALTNGAQQVRLLPGQRAVVFSMYGAPAELEPLQQLVGVMKAQKLGNGFDPGPSPYPSAKPLFDYLATIGWPVMCYSGAEMQIKGGRGVLGRENELTLA